MYLHLSIQFNLILYEILWLEIQLSFPLLKLQKRRFISSLLLKQKTNRQMTVIASDFP